ncbi:hypothetical protein PHMEG_00013243 [Phytophthora megakarya]|uniref:M96 mating-specific protein n=1 Tax=Phytophthora megakarya TaxID=4795 RepID=A0A225W8E3_9STRA|nr:hypothetical protein PHMEG_00013243 [Phytophthora megakarya]
MDEPATLSLFSPEAIETTAILSPAHRNCSPEPPKKKSKTSNQRQKEELIDLRNMTQRLEQELMTLKQQKQQKLIQQDNSDSATSSSTFTPQRKVLLWETVAEHQRVEKVKVEVENVKLRKLVEKQTRLLTSMNDLLRKHRKRCYPEPHDNGRYQACGVCKEDKVLMEMIYDVDSRYNQIDSIFEHHNLGRMVTSVEEGDNASMKYSPDQGIFLEYREKKVMPFQHTLFSDVVWRSFGEGKLKLAGSQVTIIQHTEDISFSKAIFPLGRKVVTSDGKKNAESAQTLSVMKRYREANRVVHVWFAYTSLTLEDGSVSPAVLTHQGCGTMTKATLSNGSNGCVTQSYTRSVPVHSNPLLDNMQKADHCDVRLLAEVTFSAYKQSRQKLNQRLENLLLDEIVGPSKTV